MMKESKDGETGGGRERERYRQGYTHRENMNEPGSQTGLKLALESGLIWF